MGSQQELATHPLLEDKDFQGRDETSCQGELWPQDQGQLEAISRCSGGIAGDFDRCLGQTA